MAASRFSMRASLANGRCGVTAPKTLAQRRSILFAIERGAFPDIVVVTGEPSPSRLASIAIGTGDIDCVYHFAPVELLETISECGSDEAKDLHVHHDGREAAARQHTSDPPLDPAIRKRQLMAQTGSPVSAVPRTCAAFQARERSLRHLCAESLDGLGIPLQAAYRQSSRETRSGISEVSQSDLRSWLLLALARRLPGGPYPKIPTGVLGAKVAQEC